MAKDVTKLRWIAIDGSIYTEQAFIKKTEFTGKNLKDPQRISIAFNVGSTVAEHVVKLHNRDVRDQLLRDPATFAPTE